MALLIAARGESIIKQLYCRMVLHRPAIQNHRLLVMNWQETENEESWEWLSIETGLRHVTQEWIFSASISAETWLCCSWTSTSFPAATDSLLPHPERHERFIAVQLIAFAKLEGVSFLPVVFGADKAVDVIDLSSASRAEKGGWREWGWCVLLRKDLGQKPQDGWTDEGSESFLEKQRESIRRFQQNTFLLTHTLCSLII